MPSSQRRTDAPRVIRDGGAAGDPLVRLIATHQPTVARLAQRLLGWRHDVDDVVQDVFVHALRGQASYRADADVAAWLAGITVNCCRAAIRRRRLTLRIFAPAPPAEPPAAPAAQTDERLAAVHRALRKLAHRDREVLVLHYLEQWSLAQIATALELRPNAIQARLSRARKRLRSALHHMGIDA